MFTSRVSYFSARLVFLQDVRATNMLIAALRFMNALRANILDPEIYHMNPERSKTDTFRRLQRCVPDGCAHTRRGLSWEVEGSVRMYVQGHTGKSGQELNFSCEA